MNGLLPAGWKPARWQRPMSGAVGRTTSKDSTYLAVIFCRNRLPKRLSKRLSHFSMLPCRAMQMIESVLEHGDESRCLDPGWRHEPRPLPPALRQTNRNQRVDITSQDVSDSRR